MITNMTSGLDFQAKALVLRAERQQVIASNIANADTPGYVARDLDFKEAMRQATGADSGSSLRAISSAQGGDANGMTHANHIALSGSTAGLGSSPAHLAYTVQSQPSLDGNSVDLDRERANFADNAVRFEATLRFINSQSKTILSAIQGQ